MNKSVRKATLAFVALGIAGGILASAVGTAQNRPAPPPIAVKVGDPAPDFTLRSHELKDVKLSDFRGKKNVVLAFYVLAFTGG